MTYLLALDQGTTGSTALVVARDGRIVGRGYREIPQHFPRPGWVEHDPHDLFRCTVEAGRAAIAQAGVTPVAIGITNQRETVVLWDRATGEPLGRAIVWQDRRTAERCAALAPHAERIARVTGLVTDPYFSATKLEWLLAHRGGEVPLDRLAAGTVDSWLIWRLTGGAVHATDPTNASRTMLFDLQAGAWDPWLGALFGVPRDMLPEVRRSAGDFGTAAAEHFGTPLPIRGVVGDQQGALFGQGCVTAGSAKNTYGTGAFLLLHTGAAQAAGAHGMLATVACDATGGPAFALEASIFIAGAAVQWLRDQLGVVTTAADTAALAASLPTNDGVYFVPALTGLGAPHWEPAARGLLVGLTRGTGRAHLARAALEAMAYGTREVLDAMRSASGDPLGVLRVDGGAAANDWLMQFQSDVLGVPVERPDSVESTALGAAGLAGIAAEVWPDVAAFTAGRRFQRFLPSDQAAGARDALAGWRRAVRAALAWARDDG
jgi:glycerol kinase